MINKLSLKPLKKSIEEFFVGTNFNKINKTISIEKTWNKIVGKLIQQNTNIIKFSNETLFIKASNPVWRNELSLQKKNILKKINKEIKEIKEIKIR